MGPMQDPPLAQLGPTWSQWPQLTGAHVGSPVGAHSGHAGWVIIAFTRQFLDGSGEPKDGPGSDTTEMESNNSEVISVPGILQWLTGQAHKPILPNEKNDFSIHIKFNHDCQEENVSHKYHHFAYCAHEILQ
ncbi:hypothetical protein EOD39_13249 [Acipenser ruthenus]|uniref:Uncharacterized protein n=1 Tax=Acipenser ruthenus TaxID=7906 RepID=A0A444UJ57_ACIRT|nr:hypothetical protein EOD39_13249 [Acipenser ruthenus]